MGGTNLWYAKNFLLIGFSAILKDMSAANDLTNKIIDFIYRQGGYAWRASSVGVFDTKQMHFRAAAKKGVSDILSCYKGRLIAVEVKIGKDRLSDEQTGFMRNVIHAGGAAFIASDFEQFKREWKLCTEQGL